MVRYFVAAVTLLYFTGLAPIADGARILAIFPFPGPSQYICMVPLLKALAERGHEVTSINAFPQKQPLKNFRDIPILEVFENYDEIVNEVSTPGSIWDELDIIGGFFNFISEAVLKNEGVQRLLKSNEQFDLVIVETLLTESLYGLAHHYNASLIGYSTYGTDEHIDDLVGNVSPLSYVPLVTSGFTDRMTFWERVQNLYRYSLSHLYFRSKHAALQQQLFDKYLPNTKVDLMELRRNFSLVLLNQHFSLSFPRPYVPNMIEVGGLHINHKPTALPADMEAFINKYKDGVIYFSMGSNIKSKYLPKEKLAILLKTFGSLKQGVLWKYEDPELPGKPDNVFINKWFPQPDVLAHQNVKLFITHGGLLSVTETIFHGKPMLGIPVFYDQFLNVERAVKAGFGLRLDLNDLTEDALRIKIKRLIEVPTFSKLAHQLSERYHDQPMTPLETGVFWTEYVLRHNGAKFMRVAGQDLNFIQYHNLDIFAMLLLGLVTALFLVYYILCKVIRLICLAKSELKHKQH